MLMIDKLLFYNGILLFTILQDTACMEVFITGGKEVKKPKPWMVSMQYQHQHVCGGTLIQDQWVLTAAHCRSILKFPESSSILLGTLSLKEDKTAQRIGIQNYYIPETFSQKTKEDDIMLVKLHKKVQIQKNVKVKKISKFAKDISAGTKCKVRGWGTTATELLKASATLREAEVTVVKRDLCNSYYNGNPVITEDMLCAGSKKGHSDACWGDSGGPLECKEHIVGVVSGGNGCGNPNKPGVYSLLSKRHFSWINSIIKKEYNSTIVW